MSRATMVLLAFLAVTCAGTSLPGVSHAFTRVYRESMVNGVSGIHDTLVAFSANQTVTIWTDSLVALGAGTPDTVMHVQPFSGAALPLMSNDDCNISGVASNALASCVRFTSSTGGLVRVTVHGYRTSSVSLGLLRVLRSDGSSESQSGVFGGHVLGLGPSDNVGWNASDVVEIVRPPSSIGAGASYRALLVGRTTGCIANSIALIATSTSLYSADASIVPGVSSQGFCYPQIVVGSTRPGDIDRLARVYINDRQTADQDLDGLGTELELALLTCPQQTGGPPELCSHAKSAVDTDADGLWDGWEVLGRRIGGAAVRLPAWGADPRRKDLFVEFDWDANEYGGSSPASPAHLLAEAGKFAAPNTSITNPDGSSGISVHFDVGKSSCDSDLRNCGTVYGNWGGSGPVGASDVALAYSQGHFSSSRRGIMLFGLYCAGCGAAYQGGAKMMEADPNGLIAHELGHLLGLDHNGPFPTDGVQPLVHNCEPNYLSTMNYLYKFSTLGFSRGGLANLVSGGLSEGANPGIPPSLLQTWAEIDLVSSSAIDWNRDGVISSSTVRGSTRYARFDSCYVSDILPMSVRLDSGDFWMAQDRVPAMIGTDADLSIFAVTYNASLEVSRLRNIHFSSILRACNQFGTPRGCCPTGVNDSNLCGSWGGAHTVPILGVIDSSPAVVEDAVGGVPRKTLVYASVVNGVRRFVAREVIGLGSVGPEVVILSGGGPYSGAALLALADPAVIFVASAPVGRKLQLLYTTQTGEARRVFLGENYQVTQEQVIQRSTLNPQQSGPLTFHTAMSATVTSGGIRIASTVSDRIALWSLGDTGALASEIQQIDPDRTFSNHGRPTILNHDAASSVDINHGLEVVYAGDSALFDGQPHRTWVPSTTTQFSVGAAAVGGGGSFGGVALARYRGRMVMGTPCVKRCGSGPDAHDLQLFPFSTGVYAYPDTDSDDYATMGNVLCQVVKHGYSSTIDCNGSPCTNPCSAPSALTAALPEWPNRHCTME